MKRCSAKPYEGNEKYIFVSYCHKDKAIVFPIIEQLARDGYRIWYDEGIDPGSEWPEIIAQHLNDCSSFFAFVTNNSLNSHNCRRELNFALLKQKHFISIMLEPVTMSYGTQMQLSATQSIFKYKLDNENEFYDKIHNTTLLDACKGNINPDILVSSFEDYDEESIGSPRDPFSDNWYEQDDPEKMPSDEEEDTSKEKRRLEIERLRLELEISERKRLEEEERANKEAAKQRLIEENIERREAELKAKEEKLRKERELAEKKRLEEETTKAKKKRKVIAIISVSLLIFIVGLYIVMIGVSDNTAEINVTDNMLWGTHDSSFDIVRETTIKLLCDEDEFTVYMLPKEITVTPEKENIIELVFIDKFNVCFKTFGEFVIKDNIISISPCEDESLYNKESDEKIYILSQKINYIVCINYGDIELRLLENTTEYVEFALYENKFACDNNVVQLSGKANENLFYGISEIKVSYNLFSDKYECSVKFPDGKAIPTECVIDNDCNYLYICWDEEIRSYNGRMETFDNWDCIGITYINTYPYGFVIVDSVENGSIQHNYQKYSLTENRVETTEKTEEPITKESTTKIETTTNKTTEPTTLDPGKLYRPATEKFCNQYKRYISGHFEGQAYAKMRFGPSKSRFNVVGQIDNGNVVTVQTKSVDGWTLIYYEGVEGWVRTDFLFSTYDECFSKIVEPDEKFNGRSGYVDVYDDQGTPLNMRVGPSKNYGYITKVPDGSAVKIYGVSKNNNDYIYISFNNQFGWVLSKYVFEK